MATISPRSMRRLTSRSAGTRTRPITYVLLRWCASMTTVDCQPDGDDVRLGVEGRPDLLIEGLAQGRAADTQIDDPHVRPEPRAKAGYPAFSFGIARADTDGV